MARRSSVGVFAFPPRSTTPSFTERTKMRLPLSVSSALSASSTCALIRESDCRTTSRARAGARTARTAASTAPVSHDAARMLVPITGRARRPRSPRALARRAGHPPSAGSPISYRSTFRATAKIGRRASGATKLPVKSGQGWPVRVTSPVYGLHGTAWRRVRRGLATRRPALERGDRLVPVQLVVERLQADAERLGRLLLVPAVLVQGGENEAALGFGERATDLELDHPARRRSPCLRPVHDLRAQQRNVLGLDLLVGEDGGAVHGILELAHVAQPLVPPQEIQRGAVDPLLLLLGGVELGEERADQQLHVPRALAQRRQPDREHAQAIEQVLAQLAVRHRLLGLAVGGRHDADVDLEFALPADPRDDPGLEHAQQAHLQLERHLADLVEEERAALGALEEALVGACGAGEAATLVPEQLALDQGGRHRGAVERHERALSPAAELMHRLGDQLLSRAALPDRKSTRLNSSHGYISYAVFCLKKKKNKH